MLTELQAAWGGVATPTISDVVRECIRRTYAAQFVQTPNGRGLATPPKKSRKKSPTGS